MHLGPAKEARLLAYHQKGIRVSTEQQIDKQVTKFRVRTRDCYGLASKKNRVDARKGSCKTDTCVLATLRIRHRRPLLVAMRPFYIVLWFSSMPCALYSS